MSTHERHVSLDYLNTSNVGLLVAASQTDYTPYFDLPKDEDAGAMLLNMWDGARGLGYGHYFLAFAGVEQSEFVGVGNILGREDTDRVSTAGLVIARLRAQGYGRAILTAIEKQAVILYPNARFFEAEVDPNNARARKMITIAGYKDTGSLDRNRRIIYRKPRRPTDYPAIS